MHGAEAHISASLSAAVTSLGSGASLAARAASVAASVVVDILVWSCALCACEVTEVWGGGVTKRSLNTPEGVYCVLCVSTPLETCASVPRGHVGA